MGIKRTFTIAFLLQYISAAHCIARSCSQLYQVGFRESGLYSLDVDGTAGPNPAIVVNCSLAEAPGFAIINHDQNTEKNSTGYDAFGLQEDITYGQLTYNQIHDIVTSSTSCSYTLQLRCRGASLKESGWEDYFDKNTSFWDTEGTIKGADCNYASLTEVDFTITEKQNFPMKKILMGGTNGTDKEIFFRLKPLICLGPEDADKQIAELGTMAYNESKVLNPARVMALSTCTLSACAMQCLLYTCAVFSFRETPGSCNCELSYSTTYTEAAASGYKIYNMF